ncbi:MAG: hypothetical protein ACR2F1_05380 [Nitrososphaeraceae archaeon]
MKLESASITAIIQLSNILESHVNTLQLPSKSKFKELPKIVYNNSRGSEDLENNNNNIRENKNSEIIYND